ncbi:MAG TPA: hypothetical protein VGU68_12455 [Ktedonobacteraceae bacterium]|nr:hypothetical protein [Ktedonobacteraceae bacterium]HEV2661409.1 hypothetical protein [Ktedonobacteraceae bacterium]
MVSTSQEYSEIQHEGDPLDAQEREATRQAIRENAKHVLRESRLAEMLQGINKNLLKGRGRFEEYDSMVLFKWGTGYTLRHIWVEVVGSTLRFRLAQHLKCTRPAPLCDGEYHTFTSAMWADYNFLQSELKKYYDRPVSETSSD